MQTAVNITPEVLRWARRTAGMSPGYVEDKLKQKRMSAEAIENWESGRGAPTYAQLEKLAKLYRRPVAIFFFPAPPSEPDPKEQFRSLPAVYAEHLPPRLRFLVRDGLSMQINLRELFDGVNPAESKIVKDMKDEGNISAVRLAERVRAYMGVSLSEQFSWTDHDTALKAWRDVLEERGLWIFKDAFRENDYSGFCLHDDQFPVIYVNNSMPKTRQIFTLFHELAHLLRGKGGVDVLRPMPELEGSHEEEEQFCNAFAGATLVPDQRLDMSHTDDQHMQSLANQYKVSREVILRRFYNKRRVSREQYEERVQRWRDEQSPDTTPSSGGDYYATRRAYLGDRYLEIAFRRYHQQRITEEELADYLGVSTAKSLDTLEGYVLGKWKK